MVRKCMDEDLAYLRYDPYDMKALLHPVDFIVFNGMNEKAKLNDITFLSRRSQNETLNKIRNSLKSAIDREKYDWHVARVSVEGDIELE